MLGLLRGLLAAVFDRLDTPPMHAWFERVVAAGAAVGFLVHLGAIGLARLLPDLPQTLFQALDQSPLHAVYTPFSVILFYEVVLLVFALTASRIGEIAEQYQLDSLIVGRRFFKDIGSYSELEDWPAEPEAVRAVLLDMAGVVLMFLIVTVFTWLRHVTPKTSTRRDLEGFIQLKKAVAVLLLGVLIMLATLNLARWLGLIDALPPAIATPPADVDLFFFPRFFECMIFTDVFSLSSRWPTTIATNTCSETPDS